MLAAHARVLGGNASAVRAVAAGAGRNLTVGNATTVDAFAQSHELFVFGETGLGCLAAQPIGDVFHIVARQGRGHARHDSIGTLATFELLQLLDQVLRVLLGQFRVGRRARVAIGTVAGGAHRCVTGLTLGHIRLGRDCFRYGLLGINRDGRRRQSGSDQEGGKQLHGECRIR